MGQGPENLSAKMWKLLTQRTSYNSRVSFPSADTLFLFYKNIVLLAQAEYSYFSADFRLKIFL